MLPREGGKAVKVGISGIGYQCEEHLAEVLQPWTELRATGKHQLLISVAHGLLPEVKIAMQNNPETPDQSLPMLRKYLLRKEIDALVVSPQSKYEWDMRTCTLPFLVRRRIDLLWLLDLQDEIYSVDEVLRILDFIEAHQEAVWFKMNFKNYAFAPDCFVDDFVAPRVWRATRPSAIRCFHYDNSITYENGELQEGLPHCTIPRDLAFPKHLSWVGTPQYLKRKIRYQHLHYGLCSYKWDEEKNCLRFDEGYYVRLKKKIPKVHRESSSRSCKRENALDVPARARHNRRS